MHVSPLEWFHSSLVVDNDPYILQNRLAADGLVTDSTKISAFVLLTKSTGNIPVSASRGVKSHKAMVCDDLGNVKLDQLERLRS